MFRLFFILIVSTVFFFQAWAANTTKKSSYLEGGLKYSYFNWDLNEYIAENSNSTKYYPAQSKNIFENHKFYFGWYVELGHFFTKNIAAYLRIGNNNLNYTSKDLSLQNSLNHPLLFPQKNPNHIDVVSLVQDVGLQNAFLYTNIAESTLNTSILYILGGMKYNLVNINYFKFFIGGNIGLSIISASSAVEYDFDQLLSKHKSKTIKWLGIKQSDRTSADSLYSYYESQSSNMSEIEKKFFGYLLGKTDSQEDIGQSNDNSDDLDKQIAKRIKYIDKSLSFTHTFKKNFNLAVGADVGCTFKILPGADINIGLFAQYLGKQSFQIDESKNKKNHEKNIGQYIFNKLDTKSKHFWTLGGSFSIDLYF